MVRALFKNDLYFIAMDKRTGKPLGHPDNIGKGEPRPELAGSEGGSGFLGDQRQKNDRGKDGSRPKERALDGTLSKEDIEGDTDAKKPGA